MANLKSLYKDYFQKSRVFLYPALDIPRGVSVTPIQCYVSWQDKYQPQDRKLICLYNLRDDEDFVRFERRRLVGNRLFHEYYETVDQQGVYVFDYEQFSEDWDIFLEGKYSQMSDVHKKKIRTFYGTLSSNFVYVDSFLSPGKYYKIYSELLDVNIELLKKVGELCSKPDIVQETLVLDTKLETIKPIEL